ncbi:MAG: hypothetical protein A2073_01830 [Deltaproteobacteria bacterium GWC2_42_11]|nr:MAG: hypothetical protein A2073_01830 [Deltaproteobacteria bacterium GWC2_42_11]HBO84446.1 hypothetical protein [Deltaproteobacteria bacterium]
MKKFILGVIIGIVLLAAFVYFGGGDFLRHAGKEVEKAGGELKQYEYKLKDSAKKAEEGFEKVKEKIKEKTND